MTLEFTCNMENPHFSAAFTVEAVMQMYSQSFILTMASASVHVLVERANKRLSENLGIAGRKQGGILDAHLWEMQTSTNC